MLFLIKLFYATATIYLLIRGLSYIARALDARARALQIIQQRAKPQAPYSITWINADHERHLANECPEAIFYVRAYSECQKKALIWLVPATTLSLLVFLMPWERLA